MREMMSEFLAPPYLLPPSLFPVSPYGYLQLWLQLEFEDCLLPFVFWVLLFRGHSHLSQ